MCVARNIIEGHLQHRSRPIVTHTGYSSKKKKEKEKLKEREYNIEIFIVKKKCIPQNGNLFFLSKLLIFIILYLFFERVNSNERKTKVVQGFILYIFFFFPKQVI